MRTLPILLVAPFLLCVLLVSVPAGAQTAATRWDEVGPFLWGNLSWEGTKGRIVWGPNPTSVDDQPPPRADDPAANLRYQFDEPIEPVPDPDVVFVADPLPHDVVLNVSKPLELVLYLKANEKQTNPCTRYGGTGTADSFSINGAYEPLLAVTLASPERRIGGAGEAAVIYWNRVGPTYVNPYPATGYGPCLYAMHAEETRLFQGTVLTLTVEHIQQRFSYPIGFQSPHASTIRLPLLPAEDIAFRYPDFLEEWSTDEPVDDSAPTQQGILALSLLAAVGVGARRRTFVALALLVTAFSGCLGSDAPDRRAIESEGLTGTAEQSFLKDEGGILTQEGRGRILGQVYDNFHVRLAGVHVSVIGTSSFTQTDGAGRFSLDGLQPGAFRLRFDKPAFRSFEVEVTVKVGFVSRPNVMLYLTDSSSQDSRAHSHDYWNGVETKEIARQKVNARCYWQGVDNVGPGTCYYPFGNSFTVDGSAEEVRSIYPGTREVEFTITWDKATAHPDRYLLFVRTNYEPSSPNWTQLGPRASGEPFRMQTSWEMSDPGHQAATSWKFELVPLEPVPGTAEVFLEYSAETPDYSEMNVVMVIHRGTTFPLEEPHKLRWKDGNKVQTVTSLKPYYSVSNARKDWPTIPSDEGCIVASIADACYYRSVMRATPAPDRLVPPGTSYVEFQLEQSRATSPDVPWTLLYKPANIPWNAVDTYYLTGFRTAPTPVHGELKTTWKIPVTDLEADPEYARVTSWGFYIVAADEQAQWDDWVGHQEPVNSLATGPSLTITFNAWAVRDVPT